MYRVMVVDDEVYVRDLLVKNLSKSGLEIEIVAVASDGREALEQAFVLKPDIVLTDIAMSFMDGLELIAELQKAGLQCKTAVISGYDEFDYARRAISLGVKDYLLKPFLPRELESVVRKIIQELDGQKALQQNLCLLKEQASSRAALAREKMLRDLLEGHREGVGREEEFLEAGLDLAGNWFLAGLIKTSGNLWDFRSRKGAEEFLILAGNGYFSEDIHIYGVGFEENLLAVIWCGTGRQGAVFMSRIQEGLDRINKSLKKYYDIRLNCALGGLCDSPEGLEKSYREAMATWKKNLDDDRTVILYDEEKKQDELNNGQIREWKDQICFSVRTGNAEEALGHLEMLMKCYASLSSSRSDYIGVSAGELIYAIENTVNSDGYDIEEVRTRDRIQERLRYSSLSDIRGLLQQYIENCCQQVSKQLKENKTESLVKQIKMLIDNNLKNEEADLEWVALQMHFSISYVRQIFKQQTGEALGEYLIRKRMEKAGKLLQKTGLNIQEVAEECGYSDQRYFARSFKKFYGCTPTQFKKAVEKEGLY